MVPAFNGAVAVRMGDQRTNGAPLKLPVSDSGICSPSCRFDSLARRSTQVSSLSSKRRADTRGSAMLFLFLTPGSHLAFAWPLRCQARCGSGDLTRSDPATLVRPTGQFGMLIRLRLRSGAN